MTASACAANGAVITLTQKWRDQLAKNSGSRIQEVVEACLEEGVRPG